MRDEQGNEIGTYAPPHDGSGGEGGGERVEHTEDGTLKLNRKYLRELMCDAIRHCDKHDKEKK